MTNAQIFTLSIIFIAGFLFSLFRSSPFLLSSSGMLSRTLRMTFWVMYDHLGKLVLANLVWAFAVLVPGIVGMTAFMTGDPGTILVIGVPAAILMFGITLPVTTAGLAHMVKELIDTRDGSFLDLFAGMRLYWRRSIGVGVLYLVAFSSLLVPWVE